MPSGVFTSPRWQPGAQMNANMLARTNEQQHRRSGWYTIAKKDGQTPKLSHRLLDHREVSETHSSSLRRTRKKKSACCGSWGHGYKSPTTAQASLMAPKKPRTHHHTSFFVMGNAEPMNSSSSPSDTSPIGRIDRGPVRGRWGSLLRTRRWKNENKNEGPTKRKRLVIEIMGRRLVWVSSSHSFPAENWTWDRRSKTRNQASNEKGERSLAKAKSPKTTHVPL